MTKIFPEIQYITQQNNELTHAQQAGLMFKKGIKWVQIRMKDAEKELIIKQSKEALYYAEKFDGKLIINDSVDIAKEVKAHGVHLGLKDTPVSKARELLGPGCIVGGTANTFDDICMHASKGADYVGVGPFRFTETKKNLSPLLGLDVYRNIIKKLRDKQLNIPIYAIGGITYDDMDTLKEIGVHGVAMSSALLKQIKQEHK